LGNLGEEVILKLTKRHAAALAKFAGLISQSAGLAVAEPREFLLKPLFNKYSPT
jgi:hypothetical protein